MTRCFFLYFNKEGRKVEGRGHAPHKKHQRFQGKKYSKVSFLLESGEIIKHHDRIPEWWKDMIAVACKFAEWRSQEPKPETMEQFRLELQKYELQESNEARSQPAKVEKAASA